MGGVTLGEYTLNFSKTALATRGLATHHPCVMSETQVTV